MYALVRALERAHRREEVLREAAIMRGELPEED
jgi:hypothetical protein